jgi:ATP-binding cassette, subfamily B, bacterial
VYVSDVPLDQMRFAELRRRVAFVPQDGFLFDTTIGDNVRYGAPEASDDEVRTAFEQLGLTDWLGGLEQGLDTEVGERGSRLSSGERQLIALVRAWIVAPDLLVLDEATSAVDPLLEVRLRRAIERLMTERTSVTVAHRLSTAEAADEVLVFDDGRLVERGRHDELVRAGGVYARLHADWAANAGS